MPSRRRILILSLTRPLYNDGHLRPKFLSVWVRCLRLLGYRFATISDALKAPRGKFACITFDHPSKEHLRQLAPRLASLGVTATLFVATKNVGIGHPTWSDLKELNANGWEIGTLGHEQIDLTACSEQEQKQIIERSSELITKHIGEAPRSFAYPFGAYDTTTVSSLKATGFSAAVTMRAHGEQPQDSDAPYHLRRLPLAANPISGFATLLRHALSPSPEHEPPAKTADTARA